MNTLAAEDAGIITNAMQNGPYSLATDGSTDYGDSKLYPIVVKYYDKSVGRILTVLLCMPECTEASTGENIFKLIDSVLIKRNIPFENCMSFAADNANVMQGMNQGVAGFLFRKCPSIYIMKCPCHLIHLAAEKAAAQLPMHVEDTIVDIYYYLDKSSKRKQELRQFQTLCGVEIRKILKHVSTRWLSLGICIERLLQQWPALLEYFKTEQSKLKKKEKNGLRTSSTSNVKALSVIVKKPVKRTGIEHDPFPCATKQIKMKSTNSVKPVMVNVHVSDKPASQRDEHSCKSSSSKPAISTHSKPNKYTSCNATSSTQPGEFDVASYIFKQNQIVTSSATGKSKKVEHAVAKRQPNHPSTKADNGDRAMSYAELKVSKICRSLRNPNFQLYCYFLNAALPVFDAVNTLLQLDEPCIHRLHHTLVCQLKDIINRFVRPDIVNAHENAIDIPYSVIENQKTDNNLFIGQKAKIHITDHSGEVNLPEFYISVRKYYSTAVQYMIKKFPYTDPLIMHAEVADISKREHADFNSVQYFVKKFPCLSLSDDNVDKLETEFMDYQTSVLPSSILECKRTDTQWHLMLNENGQQRYGRLAKVMLGILCVFHSNADCERIFSLVTKNKTESRCNMQADTLSSLITHKQFMVAQGVVCHQQTHSKATLQKAKSATYVHLQKAVDK